MTDEKIGNDLIITRELKVSRDLLWRAWTNPEHIKQWWCPKPWTTPKVELDLRPGGKFNFLMRGPEGEEHDSKGCILDVVEKSRIAFTDTLMEGWRPSASPFFTAVITMEDCPAGTRYRARAMHKDAADSTKHEEMGFFGGWGTVMTQIEEFAKSLKG